jgi:hypothetical protein
MDLPCPLAEVRAPSHIVTANEANRVLIIDFIE